MLVIGWGSEYKRSLVVRIPLLQIESNSEKTYALSTAMFNPITRSFLTFADRTIRVFNIHGNPLATWYHMAQSPITTAVTDPRKRKLIFGAQVGYLDSD